MHVTTIPDRRGAPGGERPGRASASPPPEWRGAPPSPAAEAQGVWYRSWVCVGVEQQIPNAGDLLPATVGDVGLHVQRQPDGTLRAGVNALQHGSCWTVPAQCREGHKVRCPYVSCAFSLDSDALAADDGQPTPAMRQFLGFRPQPPASLPVEQVGPLIFLTLAGRTAPSLRRELQPALAAVPVRLEHLRYATRLRLQLACSWDQAERVLRPALARAAWAGGALAALEPMGDEAPSLGVVFPNLLLAALPNHAAAIVVKPVGRARCVATIALYVAGPGGEPGEAYDALRERWRDVLAEGGPLPHVAIGA
jgi:hypothetical protein